MRRLSALALVLLPVALALVQSAKGDPADDQDHLLPTLSGDGRYVYWLTGSSDLAEELLHNPDGDHYVVRYDTSNGALTLVTHRHGKIDVSQIDVENRAAVTGDGQLVAVSVKHAKPVMAELDIDKKKAQVFLRDMSSGRVELISRLPDKPTAGGEHGASHPAMAADGSLIAYVTTSHSILGRKKRPHKRQIFAYDVKSGKSELISHLAASTDDYASDDCGFPSVSADGRYVAFASRSVDIVLGIKTSKAQIYLYDRQTHKAQLVSHQRGAPTTPGNADSTNPVVGTTPSGKLFVVYESKAGNLFPITTEDVNHIFMWTMEGSETRVLDRQQANSQGALGTSDAADPAVSPNGQYVVFTSSSDKVDPKASTGKQQCFIFDTEAESLTMIHNSPLDADCQSPFPSNSGQVAFATKAKNVGATDAAGVSSDVSHIYLYDHASKSTKLLSKMTTISSPQASKTLQFRHACIKDELKLDMIGGEPMGQFLIMGGFSGSKKLSGTSTSCDGIDLPISPWGKKFTLEFDADGAYHITIPSSKLTPFFGTICDELTGLIVDLTTCEVALGG